MNHREVMQQALEAIEDSGCKADLMAAADALRAALAEPQEPVAWGMRHSDGRIYDCIAPGEHDREPGRYTVPLYTHPAALAEPQEMRVPMIGACQACGHEHEFPQRQPQEPSRAMLEALQIIATPQRPDGTWNRDREACRQLAAEALGFHNKGEWK